MLTCYRESVRLNVLTKKYQSACVKDIERNRLRKTAIKDAFEPGGSIATDHFQNRNSMFDDNGITKPVS